MDRERIERDFRSEMRRCEIIGWFGTGMKVVGALIAAACLISIVWR